MIKYDCHVHTRYSGDSEAEPVAQIEEAIRLGFTGMCFTDHMDLDYPCAKEAGTDFLFDIDRYYSEMFELRDTYRGRFDILIGMEVGLRNETDLVAKIKQDYSSLIDKYPLDFVIGSTHCLEYTDPFYPAYWKDRTTKEGLAAYFSAVSENARDYDCFDSSGHFDYIVRYVPISQEWHGIEDYHPSDFSDIIDEYLKTLISRGKALECNSAGIKYGLGFAHPEAYILKRYLELGGELLTVGSDGHKPEHIAYAFKQVCEELKGFGFRYYTVYRERGPVFLPL